MTHFEFYLSHVGKPWQPGASGPEAFDCWGLVRAYFLDVHGVPLPVVDVDALSPLQVRREFAEGAHRAGWGAVDEPATGDAVLLGKSGRPSHVGIWLDGALMHSVQGAGVCLQDGMSLRLSGWRVLGSYRRRA